MMKTPIFFLYHVPTAFSEGGSADTGQLKFLPLRWEAILECGEDNKLANNTKMWKRNYNKH